jgi:diguanylate cyclase (GGDEF)-like protein/PAS domain S-box-containing protein
VNSATLAWSTVWIVLTAVAAGRLWRMSGSPELFVKNGYRWLAAAALCIGLGATVQQVFDAVISGAATLRAADLISLAALPALVIGLATLTARRVSGESGAGQLGRWRRHFDAASRVWPPTSGSVLDGALVSVSLFAIFLVTTFGPDYLRSGSGIVSFAFDLARPVADLAALCLVLALVPRDPRLTLWPGLSLAAITLGDASAVASRSSGLLPGTGPHLAIVAGLALLAATPAPSAISADAEASPVRLAASWSAAVRTAGPVAAVVAVVVIAGLATFGHPVAMPAVAITGAVVVILLVIRLVLFASQASTVAASAYASDSVFRTLADSISDTVLICDREGLIEYVSPAGEFGYDHDQIVGTQLADIVHPDDRGPGVRAALTALRNDSGSSVFTGRIRGADGSWRQVTATLSRYNQPGESPALLIACHDDSEVAALRRQLTQVTFHDGLTGLPNRAYLEERIKDLRHRLDQLADETVSSAGTGSVTAILIGLDAGMLVPDLAGQPGESLVLAQAGRRLRAAAPPGAIVARWGGDQFAVLLRDYSPADQLSDGADLAGETAEQLAAVIAAEPFSLAASELSMTASIGVATAPADDADQVLGNAHAAMLKAREAGGGRVEVFSAQMHAMALRRVELAAALTTAVADYRLGVEYQPIVELATGLVTGVEALVRWVHADELISSAELTSAAQDAGLSQRLGDWLLDEAARQVAHWRSVAGADTEFGLAIGYTARQLAAPGFAESVLTALDAAGLPPEALTLQVAERALITANGSIGAVLAELRGNGVKVAIGSFGTGYASLSYLSELAVDSIKIDGSFTCGLGTDPTLSLLTTTMIGLGRDLGIEMTAVGVSRPDQVELLITMGCAFGQGDLLGPPVPADAIEPAAVRQSAAWRVAAADSGQRSPEQAGDPACSPAS